MLECINDKCGSNKNNKCILNDNNVYVLCASKIKPTHIPNYAEEQLEYAKDKENRCYNKTCETRYNNMCAMIS